MFFNGIIHADGMEEWNVGK